MNVICPSEILTAWSEKLLFLIMDIRLYSNISPTTVLSMCGFDVLHEHEITKLIILLMCSG
jgi:hypothetical protein